MPTYRVRLADGTPVKQRQEEIMVEFTRFEQIDRLRAAGWYTDDETAQFQNADADAMVVGGPTYLKNPEGQVCACSCGTERPVDGLFKVQGYNRKRSAVYANGRCIALQG